MLGLNQPLLINILGHAAGALIFGIFLVLLYSGRGWSGRRLFGDLNFVLTAGMKVGLRRPNGARTTPRLRLLRGEIEPAEGKIKSAEALRLVYFSQMREIDD